MSIKMNLVVKNGSYTTRDGQEKHRYLTIGQLHSGNDGGEYITLDAHINLAALPRKDGDTRVMVSLYEPREEGGQKQERRPPQQRDARPPRNDEPDW